MINKLLTMMFLSQAFCLNVQGSDNSPFDRILHNIAAEHLHTSHAAAAKYAATITPEGYWKDIAYESEAMTEWPARLHTDRLLAMASAYVARQGDCAGDEAMYNKIVTGLQWWYDSDPRSTNWWYQWIDSPQKTGLVLVLMRSGKQKVPAQLEAALLDRMKEISGTPDEPGSRGTGANKIDVAIHWIYRGALQRDIEVLKKGFEHAYYPVMFTTGEGLQHDYSYLQHGPQIHIGGYGDILPDKVSEVALMAVGTGFMPSQQQIDILSGYIFGCYLPSIRGRWINFNAIGRQISRAGGLDKRGIIPCLERMARVDTVYAGAYMSAIEQIKGHPDSDSSPMHRHFWRADYTLSANEHGLMSVRMVSARTSRNENGNNENMLGYFLSDGATCIATHGDEYVDIFPAWDWSMIPGTTTPHLAPDSIPVPRAWGTPGSSLFAGGLSDGQGGITAYLYDDTTARVKTKASKSWFFFGHEVLCLGSGITGRRGEPVYTTVNQTLAKGDAVAADDGSWVYHNNTAYVFPAGNKANISTDKMTGDWKAINLNTKSKIVSQDIVKIWFDHGVRPQGAKYAYIVLPGMENADGVARYDAGHIRIMEQGEGLHAIYNSQLERWYFAFFEAGEYRSDDIAVSVDRPCLLMIGRDEEGKTVMDIASPSQIYKNIKVTVTLPGNGTKEIYTLFPVEEIEFAGATKRYTIN